MNWIFLLNKCQMKIAYSVTNKHRNTEETTIVHAFTNHSKSKWLEKCERCTFEDEGSKQLTNFTQQHQNLQVMRLSTKKRKQQQKCNLVLPIEKTIDDITLNRTTSWKKKTIIKHLESQMKFQSNRQLTTDDIKDEQK